MNGHAALTLYLVVAAFLAVSAIPTFAECIRLAWSDDLACNRRSSLLWVVAIWAAIVAWPLMALVALLFLVERQSER